MRRHLSLLLAIGLLATVAVGPVSAAPPLHEPFHSPPSSFAAGEMCDFAMTVVNTREVARQTTFERADGSLVILQRGSATTTVTNVDSDESATSTGGFSIAITIHPDGSIDADGHGALFAFYFEGDPSVLGHGWFSVSGHVTEHYGADGTYLGNEFAGRSENLCETLA